jgi:hypothetical protein
MATRSFDADDHGGGRAMPAGPAQSQRYRLSIVAADMADAVRSAGGWLCDRARAGWDVDVLVPDHHNTRPLTILGATATDIGAVGSALSQAAHGAELAVTSRVLAADPAIKADVLRAVKKGAAITVWGEDWPTAVGGAIDPTEHRLSSAARAFKTYALDATAQPTTVSATELCFDFRDSRDSGGRGSKAFRPLYPVQRV